MTEFFLAAANHIFDPGFFNGVRRRERTACLL